MDKYYSKIFTVNCPISHQETEIKMDLCEFSDLEGCKILNSICSARQSNLVPDCDDCDCSAFLSLKRQLQK